MQDSFGPWKKYRFDREGFSILGSQEFDVNVQEEGDVLIKTMGYREYFKDDDLLSYITIIEDQKYAHLVETEDIKEVLYSGMEDLRLHYGARVVYENFIEFLDHDELHFRMDKSDAMEVLKGKFVLHRDRLFLVAMNYTPNMTLNKRSNYFIGSFTLLTDKVSE